MSDAEKPLAKPSDIELDSDFTEAEHREFSKLEAESPYKEIEEEVIRVPKRKEHITITRHDVLILAIICIALVIFLLIILFHPFG